MDGPQHYAQGELWLETAEMLGDQEGLVPSYRAASIAQGHLLAAIAAAHLGFDRAVHLITPDSPPPAFAAKPEGD